MFNKGGDNLKRVCYYKIFFLILELQDDVVSQYDDTSISINFVIQNKLKNNF